jgi:DNA polymerase elongation subunit (family B)
MARPTENRNPWKKKKWENVVSIGVRYLDKERRRPEVCIWRRTETGKSMMIDRDLFPSYFYIPYDNLKELGELPETLFPDSYEVPEILSLDRKKVLKLVYGELSKDEFRMVREVFSTTYESDVKYDWRYLLDNDVTFTTNRRICYFDLETDMSIDVKNTPAKILSIAVLDSFTNRAGILLLDETRHTPKMTNLETGEFIISYPTEKEMLESFIEYLDTHNPDILTAYNLVAFDFPYLVNRMKKIGVDWRKLSEIGSVYVIIAEEDNFSNKVHCAGRELMDYYLFIKKLYDEDKPDDYRLDTVAQHICGINKIEYKSKYKDIKEMYEKDKELFIKYNLQDVIILRELEKKVGFILKYFVSLQQLIPMPLASLKDNSVVLDFYILKNYNGKIVFPSKKKRDHETFKAALTGKLIVDEHGEIVSSPPDKKIFRNVGVVDFSAMYPNILKTFNISPETIIEDDLLLEEGNYVEIEGIKFDLTRPGIIPSLVNGLIELRKKYQKILETLSPNDPQYPIYYNLQYGVKRLNNSFFGAAGYSGFRLFDVRVSKSITAFGRELIKESYKHINYTLGYETIYFDTDSAFILLKEAASKEQIEGEISAIEQSINEMIDKHVMSKGVEHNYMSMDFEKRFSSLIFMGVKKRYIGFADLWKGKWLDKQKFVVKGFDLVRRDMPHAVKEMISTIIKMFLGGIPDEEIKKYYISEIKKITSQSIYELAWSKGITKPFSEYKNLAQHIGACVASHQNYGFNFRVGDYPKLMYVKPGIKFTHNGKDRITPVLAFQSDSDIPEDVLKRIDYNKYIDSFIIKKLEVFFDVEGMNIKDILQHQDTLESYGIKNAMEELLNG